MTENLNLNLKNYSNDFELFNKNSGFKQSYNQQK